MRRFRCDGSQFGHAINLPEGLGSRIENVLFAVYSRPQNRVTALVFVPQGSRRVESPITTESN